MKKYKREKRLDYYVALVNETSEKRKELTRLFSIVDNEIINIYKKKMRMHIRKMRNYMS